MTITNSETAYEQAVSQRWNATGPASPSQTVTLAGVVRSELIKLRSVTSTIAGLLTTVVLTIAIPTIATIAVVARGSTDGDTSGALIDPTGGSLSGIGAAVFAVLTLGVLAVSGEYSTGTIRSSLAAVPKRSRLVWGKALAVFSVTLPVGVASAVAAFLLAQLILSSGGHSISLTEPGVARAVIGAGLYLSVAADHRLQTAEVCDRCAGRDRGSWAGDVVSMNSRGLKGAASQPSRTRSRLRSRHGW